MTLSSPDAEHSAVDAVPPIRELLGQLHVLLQAQAEAINNDSFEALERLTAEREPLVAQLNRYVAGDLSATDRALVEQVAALDQQLVELARESILRTGQEIRDLDRGRAALNQYGQRGRQLIQNLAYLNQQD